MADFTHAGYRVSANIVIQEPRGSRKVRPGDLGTIAHASQIGEKTGWWIRWDKMADAPFYCFAQEFDLLTEKIAGTPANI